jgi:nicotinamidase/pyrazinamidase
MKSALIIMDMQYDFCEGGIFPHDKSLIIIPKINRMRDKYDLIIFVKKQLQHNHSIFKQYGGNYFSHCVVDTIGEKIHADLIVKPNDIIINRGTLQKYNSNTAFYDAEAIYKPTRLKQILQAYEIQDLYFCGNGMDNSIYSTVIDAVNNKYKCNIITNAVTCINETEMKKCMNYLKELGVTLIEFV